MKRAMLALLCCTGCDKLFGVQHVNDVIDGHTSTSDAVDADIPTCQGGDEDCDMRANDVDFCPADADTPIDDDADGVGNLCDPDTFGARPNHRAFFDGFDDATTSWTSAAWHLEPGVFRQPQISDTAAEKTVTAKYPGMEVIVPELTTVGNGNLTIYGKSNALTLKCKLTRRSNDGAEFLEVSGTGLIAKEMGLAGTGTLRIMGGQLQSGEFYCRARNGANPDVVVTTGNTVGLTIDTVGMSTSSASVTVSSVTLFEAP